MKGHEFGLDLSSEDRKALIAFLRTLGEVESPLSEALEFKGPAEVLIPKTGVGFAEGRNENEWRGVAYESAVVPENLNEVSRMALA